MLLKNKIWHSISFLIIVTFVSLASGQCLAQSNTTLSNNFVIAKVGNSVITNYQLLDRFRLVLHSARIKSIKSSIEKDNFLRQLVDRMIDEEIIRQEAQNLKIAVSNEELELAVENAALQQKLNPHQLKINLSQHNISFDRYLRQIESDLLWSKIITQIIKPRLNIADAELREYLEQRNISADIRKFHLAQIFISDSNYLQQDPLLIANKIVAELRTGADFKNMAKQFSQASLFVEDGGDMGWVSQSDMDQKIYSAVVKLRKGGYSDPVMIGDGYHIFKLIDSSVEPFISEDDAKIAQITISTKKLQAMAKGYLSDLRRRIFVEIQNDKISLL